MQNIPQARDVALAICANIKEVAGLRAQRTERPIPAESPHTGITDEMVVGHRIDDAAVDAFVDDAAIVIARNSGFDRKFAERYWPVLEQKAWGCSATEIEWKKHGFAGGATRLPAERSWLLPRRYSHS